MMEMKYLEKLEFNKIKEILEGFAKTYVGKEMVSALEPLENKKEVQKALRQTTEATTLLYRKGNLPLDEIANILPAIKKLNAGANLSAKELLETANILRVARELKEYFASEEIDMTEFEGLHDLFNNLYNNIGIEKEVFTAILDENTIADMASKELANIRRNMRAKEQEIRNKLNSLIHSKFVQEPVITIRSGRFVIPVKNEYRSEVKGFMHDTSASGSTVFIEPISVFELNNDLNNLKNDEEIEIQKILMKLSSLFFELTDELKNNVNLIGLIDFIFAKAKYSNSLNATEPKINDEKYIDLKNAYHPLISESVAVKNDISIGKTYTNLVITGPNTGGKTVVLKTVGLLTLMAMSGLHITAKEGSSVFLFDNIFADIGDEQSIADSLSTFSSHMTNIASILNNATENSLVLLDELGSGTDPIEGANLAISILENLNTRHILNICTTHYPDLKHYALVTEGFENASVEFDIEKLAPTYRLLLGVPGTSNAFAISGKLGIPADVISRAKERLTSNEISIEELLKNIYEDKRIIEQEKQNVLQNSKEIEELKNSLEEENSKLQKEKSDIISKAKNEAREIVLSAKDEVNDLIKEVEQANSSKELNNTRNKLNKKLNELSKTEQNMQTNKQGEPVTEENVKIGMKVFVSSLNQVGEIVDINKAKKTAKVQLGLASSYFEYSLLTKREENTKTKKEYSHSSKHNFAPKAVSAEINVIGQTVEEACFSIDKYLDTCVVNGLMTARIVHGKGTGALRTGIHKFLKNHPHVQSYRVGTYGEGEMGVTIVELR